MTINKMIDKLNKKYRHCWCLTWVVFEVEENNYKQVGENLIVNPGGLPLLFEGFYK